LAVRLATENPGWGFDRIRDALTNLGYEISDANVSNILKEHERLEIAVESELVSRPSSACR
jgi:hypothetical protein